MDRNDIRKLFDAKDRFGAKLTGVRFVDASAGYSRCSLTVEDHHLNNHDILHGGAIFTLVDMAAGTAAATDREDFVTLTTNITYSAPGYPGETIYAEAKISGRSKRMSNYIVTVTNESGKILATATAIVYDRAPK